MRSCSPVAYRLASFADTSAITTCVVVLWLVLVHDKWLLCCYLCCRYADAGNGGTIDGTDRFLWCKRQNCRLFFSNLRQSCCSPPVLHNVPSEVNARQMFQGWLNYFEKKEKASSVANQGYSVAWGTDTEVKHSRTPTVDQRTPLYSRSIMWLPCYICEALARRTPPFLPSAIPGCGAEVRAFLGQSDVASDQEWNHQILSGFDKNETSPLCLSGEPLPGNLRVIRESKHTGRTPFSSDGRQSWPPGWWELLASGF